MDPADPETRWNKVIEPEAAKWVVGIFEQDADGLGGKAIASELNRLGVPAPAGSEHRDASTAEACFLMRKVHAAGPAEVLALGRKGVYELSISIDDHWTNIEALLKKHADRPISLADACLIRSAEIHAEARILTFDSDFLVYRWSRNKRFQLIE